MELCVIGVDGELVCWFALESSSSWIEIVATWAPIMIALAAFVISMITAWHQIRLQKQEWRPYLRFVRAEVRINASSYSTILHFENTGKCSLEYIIECEGEDHPWLAYDFSVKKSGIANPNAIFHYEDILRGHTYASVGGYRISTTINFIIKYKREGKCKYKYLLKERIWLKWDKGSNNVEWGYKASEEEELAAYKQYEMEDKGEFKRNRRETVDFLSQVIDERGINAEDFNSKQGRGYNGVDGDVQKLTNEQE